MFCLFFTLFVQVSKLGNVTWINFFGRGSGCGCGVSGRLYVAPASTQADEYPSMYLKPPV
ncbi:hypothetical protein PGT21_032180 [Puccinia graminis f. sp. tritici]|uniref:Uncharacterized protein n=1 Tax=Puccinia graminis f. sp. tritici TaxID=56615 RepID=A0A5B0QZD2_PUCGR|nr:hypothetical protein PGT21_032180 [Puccinia graminis f. sp. tritici]